MAVRWYAQSRYRPQWRRALQRRRAADMRDAISFRSLPLPRNRNYDPYFSFRCHPRRRRALRYQLIDEQERHSGLKIIKQLLERRLLDFAAHRDADKAILGLRPLQVHLRVRYVPTE